MKIYPILILLVCLCTAVPGWGQISKQIAKIYEANNYREVVTVAGRINTFLNGDEEKDVDDLEGRSYYALQMYDSAIYFENKALSLDNDATWVSGWAYTFRGMALYRQGKKAESVSDLQKAISLDKTHNSTEIAKEFLSEIVANSVPDDSCAFLFSQGEYKRAIQDGRKQLQQQDYKSVLQLVGAAYANIHYYDSAIYFERRALAIDKDATSVSGWAHVYLGIALFKNNEKDKAVEELRTAIELNKTSNSVRKAENMLDDIINGRSLVIDSLHQAIKDQLNSDNYRGAATTAIAFLAANPADALAWDQLCSAYCWLHNYDSSLYCGQKALSLDKEETIISCEVHHHMGIDYFMKNNPEAADAAFSAALGDHSNDNLKKKVKHARMVTGIDDSYDRWKTVETDHIVFHFQDKKGIDNLDGLMDKYEREYVNASKLLRLPLPKKIDVFIWERDDLARKALLYDKEVKYANADLCVLHTAQNENRSPDLMHILGFWQKTN